MVCAAVFNAPGTVVLGFLSVASVGLAVAGYHSAARYNINLDLRPEERWTEIATKHSHEIRDVISQVLKFSSQFVPEGVMETLKGMELDLVNDLPYPYGAELQGIMRAVNISTAEAFFMNMIYELSAFEFSTTTRVPKACTSIIAQTPGGEIYHARNMDYFFKGVLKNLTITLDFLENGQVSYTGTTFVGLVGLFTGQKPHSFTVSLNQRNVGAWWMNALEAIITGTHGSASLLLRDTLSNPLMDFKSAVGVLSNTPLIASSYIIVAGVHSNEGVVITRGRPRATDMWWLGSNHTWFLVETNSDHWNFMDDRRSTARQVLGAIGRGNLTSASLWEVLSVSPVRNPDTIYSVVMSAAKPGLYNTRVWD